MTDNVDRCPICAEPFKPNDICATDIELLTVHAECMDGCEVVDLETGEPTGKPLTTYRYSEVMEPAPPQTNTTVPEGWKLVPRTPTDAMMQAGLYQSSHDAQWADVYSSWEDMVDAAEPPPQTNVPCPCTLIEQDEDCPVGYPSLLCGICEGKGNTTPEQVTALACEMLKIASDTGGPEDPFAAWESIDLIKSQHVQLRNALQEHVDACDADDCEMCHRHRALIATTEGQDNG